MGTEILSKISKKKINILWLILLVSILIIVVYIFFYSAQVQGYKYAFAYNNRNFEKVFEYYHKDTVDNQLSKEEIVDFLKQQIEIDGPLKINQTSMVQILTGLFKPTIQVNMKVVYGVENKGRQESLTLVRDYRTRKWLVKFPYELQSIYVFAPTGSQVYIGGKKVQNKGISEEIEIKNTLPGRHQITIQYYEDIYPPFTTEIVVPKQTRVDSPYPTYNIAVFAPYNTWVTLGNVTKYNSGPSVLFTNMLPGQYKISIAIKDRELEIFSQTVQIDKEYTSIHLEKIVGNKAVKESLEKFFEIFNIEYEKGIKSKDSNFLHMFAKEKIDENLISDFKMWYIDNKDVKDAKSLMEIRDMYILSGTELKASVLETVYLTNEGKEYRVVIEWNYKLVRNNSKWEIAQRHILQSIVAYKNEEGKWIRY